MSRIERLSKDMAPCSEADRNPNDVSERVTGVLKKRPPLGVDSGLLFVPVLQHPLAQGINPRIAS